MNLWIQTDNPARTNASDIRSNAARLIGDRPPSDGIIPALRVRFLYVLADGVPFPIEKPSLDAGATLIATALEGLAWKERRQILSLHVSKERANKPGIHVSW